MFILRYPFSSPFWKFSWTLALFQTLQRHCGPSFAIFLTAILSSSRCSFHGAWTLQTLAWTFAVASCPLPCPPLPRASPATTLSSSRSVTSTHVSWMTGQRGDSEGRRGGRGGEREIREKQYRGMGTYIIRERQSRSKGGADAERYMERG